MMNIIVNEDKITFKDLEQKIFKKRKKDNTKEPTINKEKLMR